MIRELHDFKLARYVNAMRMQVVVYLPAGC
jgi:hypothetical protein